jgi:hypothetical protein
MAYRSRVPSRHAEPSGPLFVPVFLVLFAALGLLLAFVGNGERAAAIAMTGFGLWGLCLWSAVDAGSPVPSSARPWAALGGTLVAVLTAVAMVRSGPSTSLSDQALLGLSLALGVALGVAGVVVAVRAFRDRASRGT